MKGLTRYLVAAALVGGLLLVGCAQTPAASPTAAPAAPPKAAEPTKAPAAPATAVAQPTAVPAQPTAVPAKKVDFPAKGRAVTVIVPVGAGGTIDIASRTLAPQLEKELGAPVQIVNKEGASSQVGMTEVMSSRPDGYTLGIAILPTIFGTYLDPQRKGTYTRKDFQTVAHFVSGLTGLFVKSDSPYKTLKDFVDDAKANPGKIKVASAGLLGNTHLGMIMLEELAGIKVNYVHFNGGGPAHVALLGGHVDASFAGVSTELSAGKSGDVRALGIADAQESKDFPGVKTMDAQGYKLYASLTAGLAAPAGTPKEVVDILAAGVKRATANADVKDKFDKAGLTPVYMDAAQFEAYWVDQEPKVKRALELARQQ